MESENLTPPTAADSSPDAGSATDAATVHTKPALPPDRGKWPFRIVGAIALGLAIWFCVYAFGQSPDTADNSPVSDPAIVQQVPSPGSHVLRQSQVGVLLKAGFDGRISVNGRAVPESQMDGALAATTPAAAKEISTYGVRPNDKNQVFFTPGPGKVISRYTTGEVNITVTLWQISLGPSHSRTVSWAVFVT